MSKKDKGMIAIIIVIMLTVFAVAFTAGTSNTDTTPKRGSYTKCEQYGVKGFCVRWSVVKY